MKRIFGSREFILELISIAFPLAMQSVVSMVVNMIDSIMIGSLGDIALSGVNISSQFPFLGMTTAMGISNAGLIIASQAWGNKKPDQVKSMVAFCLRLSFIISLFFFAAAMMFPSFIISIYSNDASIIRDGAVYLRIISLTLPLMCVSTVLCTMVRSAGLNKLGLQASLTACIVNMIFNWILIFGHLGFAPMGLKGAAIATVIARVCEIVVVFTVVLRDKKLGLRVKDIFLKTERAQRQDFIKIGTPTIIGEMTGTLNVSAAAMITGRVSSYYIAANSIVHNIWTISSLFMFGVGMGAGVMIGHAIGANEMDKAEEYAGCFIRIGLVIGIVGAIMTQVLAPLIISFYNVSPEAIATAGKLKNAASIAVFFLAMQVVICKGLLRGAGQAGRVTRVDLISCWLVNLPAGFLVALVLKMDPFWIYLSLRLDYLIKTVWGLRTIRKGSWMVRLNVD